MYLEVYPDIIFILNFSFDFILLYLLKKINRRESKLLRILLGAMVGGVVAVIAGIFPWMATILKVILLYFAGSLLMIVTSFGVLKPIELLKQWVVLNLITYFIGGWIQSVYYHTKTRMKLIELGRGIAFSDISWRFIAICLFIITPLFLLCLRMYRIYKGSMSLTYTVELVVGDQHVVTQGLMDTGNALYDPIYSCPVIVLEDTLLHQLLPPELSHELDETRKHIQGDCLDTMEWNISEEWIGKIRWIPYHAVGKSGMMLGFQLDKLYIHMNGEILCNEKVTAAISNTKLSMKSEYHVILHKELI